MLAVDVVSEEDQDPCANQFCGAFSTQSRAGGRCVCSCQRGYFGTPPNCRPECVVSSDCSQTTACLNQKCRDPCPGSCGNNARCQVVNHNPICSCPAGYAGDPFINCVKEPEVVKPPERPHVPCVPSPCGPNAMCREVNGHEGVSQSIYFWWINPGVATA